MPRTAKEALMDESIIRWCFFRPEFADKMFWKRITIHQITHNRCIFPKRKSEFYKEQEKEF